MPKALIESYSEVLMKNIVFAICLMILGALLNTAANKWKNNREFASYCETFGLSHSNPVDGADDCSAFVECAKAVKLLHSHNARQIDVALFVCARKYDGRVLLDAVFPNTVTK